MAFLIKASALPLMLPLRKTALQLIEVVAGDDVSGPRIIAALVLLIAIAGGGLALFHAGLYGLTLFILVPIFIGALGAWSTHPRTAGNAAAAGALTALIATSLLLVVGLEGLICHRDGAAVESFRWALSGAGWSGKPSPQNLPRVASRCCCCCRPPV